MGGCKTPDPISISSSRGVDFSSGRSSPSARLIIPSDLPGPETEKGGRFEDKETKAYEKMNGN